MKRVYNATEEIPKELHKNVIFLAGPIQGAPDWQKDAIEILLEVPNLIIANPRRSELNKDDFNYNQQVEWESKYLDIASTGQGILFWLANPIEQINGRSYAQTSRFELGEWYAKYMLSDDVILHIGIEEGFHGERYIKKKFETTRIWIYDNLYEMCNDKVDSYKFLKSITK